MRKKEEMKRRSFGWKMACIVSNW